MNRKNASLGSPSRMAKAVNIDTLAARALLAKHEVEILGASNPGKIIFKAAAKPGQISYAHALGKKILATTHPLFVLKRIDDDRSIVLPTEMGANLLELFQTDFDSLLKEYSMYKMSPMFRAMMRLRRRFDGAFVGVPCDPEVAESHAQNLNGLVSLLRRLLGSKRISEGYANFRRSALENFKSMTVRFKLLPKKVSILRLDLHGRDSQSDREGQLHESDAKSLPSLQCAHAKFQRWFNKEFAGAILDHFWCLEHAERRGPHYHGAIILDPEKYDVRDDAGLVDMLGAKWKELTHDRGDYYNANENKEKYKYRALGLVDTSDVDVIKGWTFTSAYFTLAGLFVQFDVPQRTKTFGKKRVRVSKGRRPSLSTRPVSSFPIGVADILARGLTYI